MKLLACILAATTTLSFAGEWVQMFDGKTLNGWTQKNGTATYRVEEGAIIGKTAKGSPNSFLCSDKEYGNFEFNAKTTSYGLRVMEWVTPFGVIHIKRHPLFSYETTNRRTMIVFEPNDLRYRYIDDTSFYDDPAKRNTGWTRRDGTKEEFLTECGLEMHHPSKCGYLNGFGSDNGTP